MDKVFLDTNILLDYLAARAPFDEAAKKIIHLAEQKQIEIFISTLSVCNIAYILRKLSPNTDTNQVITELSSLATLTNIDENVIYDALASAFSDFEDGVQYFSAVRHG